MNNIKKIIREKRIRQNEICQALGINESVLSLIISGRRTPSQQRLKDLAKYLKVSIKQMYPQVKIRRINFYDLGQ